MIHKGLTGYCVLCGKPIFQGHEIDKVPLDVPPYRKITAHKECCKAYLENWAMPLDLPMVRGCEKT